MYGELNNTANTQSYMRACLNTTHVLVCSMKLVAIKNLKKKLIKKKSLLINTYWTSSERNVVVSKKSIK